MNDNTDGLEARRCWVPRGAERTKARRSRQTFIELPRSSNSNPHTTTQTAAAALRVQRIIRGQFIAWIIADYAMPNDVEVGNRAGVLPRKIDIRGEGGYVAAPPSLHPNGTPYVWRTKYFEIGLPRFDAAWLTPAHQEQNLPLTASTVKVRKAVAYISRIRAVAGEGGHNATFRAACKLRDAGFSQEEALAVLSDWNETNATPPWSAQELEHNIHSAYLTGK